LAPTDRTLASARSDATVPTQGCNDGDAPAWICYADPRMSYVVLARKWRPRSFDDLVGQEHVSTTLRNAIAQNRVAHAFLFTGVRGVGKTTSARILAKTLNCVNGPTANPCQTCAPCAEITVGADVDVQEIDGASYNGVEEVRRLQESLPYRPSRDRFKIFIVDEVHMLSNAAWNAFLKTLEEPPPHVKFIFATTEVHKVPITILSRCQRYDFKMIGAQAIAARLKWVLEQEGVQADDAAVATVAREAAGSMRDAMSLLDQVIAWVGGGGERLTAEGVARVLGVADRVVLHRLAEAVIEGDAGSCLRIVGDLAREGYDLPHVARDFLAQLRDLVVAKVSDNPGPLLDMADAEVADVKAIAEKSSVEDLTRLHQGFSRSFDDIVRSGQPRAALEMALVRLSRRPPLVPVDELLRRLGELERRLGSGGGGAPPNGGGFDRGAPPGRGGGPSGGPARRPSASGASGASASGGAFEGAAMSSPGYGASSGGGASPRASAGSVSASSSEPPPAPVPGPFMRGGPAASGGRAAVSGPAMESLGPRRPSSAPVAPVSSVSEAVGASGGGVSVASVANGGGLDLVGWRATVDVVRAKRPRLASVLDHAGLLQFGPDRVVLGYANSFLMSQATEASAKEILFGALRSHFGVVPELSFETLASKDEALTVAAVENAERRQRVEAMKRAVVEHPLVTAAIELVGAELKDVRLADAEGG